MSRVVPGAYWARIRAFFVPDKASTDGNQQQYRRHPFLLWLVAGLGFPALGWMAGGLLGSWSPRTGCAVAATALALGILNRRPGAALIGALSAGAVSLVAVRIGEFFLSPLLAWPVAGLVIGVMGAWAFRRRRARIAFVIGAPVLGFVGVLAGMTAIVLAALGLNDSRVMAQLMLGGAAGFGFLLMAGAALTGRWLDVTRKTGGVS